MPTPNAAASPKRTIQCFKPGTFTAMSGQTLAFSAADLAAAANAYDPALHEAPLVVGHPQLDGPAYGWVNRLAFAGGALEAQPHQVNPEFAQMVNAGAFKKVSAAFWAPDAPGNPKPGVLYLRHVGFLGATAPAVSGLRTPAFAGGEEGVLEFADWDDVNNASLWRGLRDWLLGKFGQAEADTAVPGWLVASVEQAAAAEAAADTEDTTGAMPNPAFAQATAQATTQAQPESAVTPEQKAALEAENARLRQQLADATTAQRTTRIEAARSEGLAFADGLLTGAQIGPDDRNAVAGLFVAITERELESGSALMFASGDGTTATQAPLLPALKTLLQGLAPRVATGQHATTARAAVGGETGLMFAAPPGSVVRPERTALLGKARAYQAAHPGTDFVAACRAVGA